MFHEGDILCSKYKLKTLFNKGGFSSVWLARDLKAQVDFALKIYDNLEDMEEFRKGFNLVVNLTHSNIFKPLAYDIHEGVPFLVMSYCHNGSVSSRIGKMTEDEIWTFIHDVAAGLAYLHDKKAIVHQDIKPGNILVDDDGKYMITDFDISTRQRHTQRMTARQVQEMQDFNYGSGTPDYMGPERWPDKEEGYHPPVKPIQASDIWSLGATLFELMTGQVPFGETGGAYQRNLCRKLSPSNRMHNAVPQIAGNYSKELRKLVYMCLAKDTWDRPSAKQIEESALLHKAPVMHPTLIPRWVKYAVGGGCLALVGISVILWPRVPPRRPPVNDSIYIAIVDSATEIIRSQKEMLNKDSSYKFNIEKIEEAYSLHEKADTMKYVTDSARTLGQETWLFSQEIINNEYKRLDSLEQHYKRMDATDAALEFARKRYELEKYIIKK